MFIVTLSDHLCSVLVLDPGEIIIFSDEEWERFQTRVDEGYDLAPTGRYLEWLKIYHPDHIPQGIACVCVCF